MLISQKNKNLLHLSIFLLSILTPSTSFSEKNISYRPDIQEIFATHCIECHGKKRKGGLRLDNKYYALLGGTSGLSILSTDLNSSELYQRVNSTDPDYRMPPVPEDQLTSEQLLKIKEWLQNGYPWEEENTRSNTPQLKKLYKDKLDIPLSLRLRNMFNILKYNIYKEYTIYIFVIFGFYFLYEIIILLGKNKILDVPGFLQIKTAYIRFTIVGLSVLTFVIFQLLSLSDFLSRNIESWKEQAVIYNPIRMKEWEIERAVYKFYFGDPPKPFRPPGKNSINTIIYRGNDERNPKLPNNGIYRTCTFHLTLVDRNYQTLKYGDNILNKKTFIKLLVNRAPGSNKSLFDEKIISKLFLSSKYHTEDFLYDKGSTGITFDTQPIRFRIIESFNKFVTYIPLPIITNSTSTTSTKDIIYIYESKSSNFDDFVVEPHYAIVYQLNLNKGNILDDSDLWIGNLYWNPDYELPESQRITNVKLSDWHSRQPIPIAESDLNNITNPKLIGIDKYSPTNPD